MPRFPFENFFLRLCKGYMLNLIEDKYQNNCLPPLLINMWPKYLWKPSDESIVVDSPKLVVQLGPGRERPYLQNKLVGRPPRWKWFRGKRTFLSDLLSKLWKRGKKYSYFSTEHSIGDVVTTEKVSRFWFLNLMPKKHWCHIVSGSMKSTNSIQREGKGWFAFVYLCFPCSELVKEDDDCFPNSKEDIASFLAEDLAGSNLVFSRRCCLLLVANSGDLPKTWD